MFGLIKKIFGTAQTRKLKRYRKIVAEVNRWEEKYQELKDEELPLKTAELKKRIAEGESVDNLLPEAYGLVKNACRRMCGQEIHVSGYDQKWDMVPYDVQILGAIAMHFGNIAEMQTGEGKTLTASMPLYLNALTGKPVHLITVNDYLAKRDCEWMGAIFVFLGLTVRSLTNNVPIKERKEVYKADIVYGTSSEFGFDYLRDNSTVQSKEEQCQRGFYFAMIDEVDSILIDEARTPLIISGPSATSRQMYEELKDDVAKLVKKQRDLCNKLATDGRKVLERLGLIEEKEETPKLTKKETEEASEAYRKLWLVSKGTPNSRVLKRLKENPSIRSEIEKWDTYFYAEPNRNERAKILSELFIVIDERSNDHELTDQGIQYWLEWRGGTEENNDFVMLDLGHEYALIDQEEISEQEKMQKKVELRERDSDRKERAHNLRQLLRAHLLMEKDVDYIISNNEIVIIDENTGRPQPGRRFSDGLHQSIEAKENVPVQSETQTYATITLQNYFRMYDKLSGMTGTAMTEANEFFEIYKTDVLAIPTYRPCKRKDEHDEIYMTEREKYNAILKDVQEIHKKGAPILIGTESVEISEKLSRILRQHKLPHTVLNAKNHEKEAEIIAEAGRKGAITIATNMAGRGTDIKLKEGAAEAGGLHVLGTTRHQSRRIDRQLRGRSARLGDPGYSKFYISFEDSLMRLFASPRITQFLKRMRPPEGEAIKASMLNKSIETAQKRVEQRNYTMRKHTLEYDDVMNQHRTEIYSFRNEILHTEDPVKLAGEVLEEICFEMADKFQENTEGYRQWLMTHFPVTFEAEESAPEKVRSTYEAKIANDIATIQEIQDGISSTVQKLAPEEVISSIIRNLLVRNIDQMWQEHLLHIDYLRTEVNLRVVAQKDPLLEFKHEAFALFGQLSTDIKLNIAHALFKFQMIAPPKEQIEDSIRKVQRKKRKARFRASLSNLDNDE